MKQQLYYWLVGLLFTSVACTDARRAAQDEAGEVLLEHSQALHCDLQRLQVRTDSLWDEVSTALDRDLPKDMRQDHRKNMINLRNTDLIKMFEVYPALDTLVKAKVEKAGLVDQDIAAAVKALRQKIEVQDSAVLAFLGELEKASPGRYRYWLKKFEAVKNRSCE